MLEELYSDTGLLNDDVEFHQGINIVLGKYAKNKQESGINGIGKSSLIRLIDYVLLSDGADRIFAHEKYGFLRDENHTITLKLKIGEESHYIRRSFGKRKGIIGFGKSQNLLGDYELRELRSKLLDKIFPITDEAVRYEGERFRTLFNFFIKDDLDQRQRKDPLDFFPYRATTQEKFAYNFFLLGLPNSTQFKYGADIKRYRELNALVRTLKEEIQTSTGKRVEEFKSECVVLEQRISLLEKSLRDYKFLEKYKDIEKSLSELSDQINERLKTFHALSRKLKRLRELNTSDDSIDLGEINAMYAELSATFAGLVKKKLDEIITFKKTLLENRVRHNLERERHIYASIREVEAEIAVLKDQRARLLRQLEEKGELDSIANTYEQLVTGVLTQMVEFLLYFGYRNYGSSYGNHRSPISTDRELFAPATRQRKPVESASSQCHSVCGRARLQMARPAKALWQLAHDLYAHESLVQERGDGSSVRALAAGSDRPHQDRGRIPGQHDSEGSSGRHRGAKKNGPQSIGKSRGGWSTKIHMVAADARTAITFALSPGQAHDAPEGRALLNRLGRPNSLCTC